MPCSYPVLLVLLCLEVIASCSCSSAVRALMAPMPCFLCELLCQGIARLVIEQLMSLWQPLCGPYDNFSSEYDCPSIVLPCGKPLCNMLFSYSYSSGALNWSWILVTEISMNLEQCCSYGIVLLFKINGLTSDPLQKCKGHNMSGSSSLLTLLWQLQCKDARMRAQHSLPRDQMLLRCSKPKRSQ